MSRERGPVIGVPCFSAERAGSRRPIYGNNQAYINAVIAAGGIPLLIPPMSRDEALEAVCERLDGLLLTGGEDVDPASYGEETLPFCGPVAPERDALELALTRMALERDLPTLGICRGMQLLNVARGGSLYQDIQAQEPAAMRHALGDLPRAHRAHEIEVERASALGSILGVERLAVNSLHHQAVRRPGDGLRIVARAEDGVAEGMELPGYRFVVAVQYHPEELVETDELSRRLFAAFTRACADARG